MSKSQTVRVKELSRLVREKRKRLNWILGDLANETGISASTLSRLEREYGRDEIKFTPSMKTVMALTQWLNIPIEEVLEIDSHKTGQETTFEYHLEQVASHLRSAKSLDEENVQTLSDIFHMAFTKAAKKAEKEDDVT